MIGRLKYNIIGSLFKESGPIMIDDVIFDLYGTLVDIHTDEERPELWEKLAARYKAIGAAYTPGELKSGYFDTASELQRIAGEDARTEYPEIDIGMVFKRLFEAKGVPAGDVEIRETAELFRLLSTEYIRLYPGTVELIRELRGAGKRVWLLTNAQRLFTAPELERLGIGDMFDGVYISSDYGVKKPDRRFFRILLNERRIEPSRAVMVGNDGTCDIMGAKGVGLHTVYVRSNLSPKERTPEADIVIEAEEMAHFFTKLK